ncbi:MAG: hypothetical protein LBD68_05840, partial [Zoogloeaceae bacterium]|nr:hypothetical protein [Zoogloeaceae bacterium]
MTISSRLMGFQQQIPCFGHLFLERHGSTIWEAGVCPQGNRMNTFVIALGCLPGYSTSEAPPEREVGGLQTRPCRQFHRCKPL